MLAQHGWRITIDLFAAACNRFTARYASWTDEPESEAVDAFTVPSWDQSMCSCGRIHRETAFFFPPRGLEKAVVRRAKSDGVKAAFLVPTSYKAGYWEALLGRAVAQLQLDEPATDFANVQAPLGAHALFLADFGSADNASPVCGQEREVRRRREHLGPIELEELARVKTELRRLEAEASERQQAAQA